MAGGGGRRTWALSASSTVAPMPSAPYIVSRTVWGEGEGDDKVRVRREVRGQGQGEGKAARVRVRVRV